MTISKILQYINNVFLPRVGCSASLTYIEHGYYEHSLNLSVWYNDSAHFFEIDESELQDLPKLCADIKALLSDSVQKSNLYTHTKTGNTCALLFEATNCTNGSCDGDKMAVYKSVNSGGAYYCRELTEFRERFKPKCEAQQVVGYALNDRLDVSLCGSAIAHANCRYAGEVTESHLHKCSATADKYSQCEFADKGGLIHKQCGIET